MSCLFLLTLTLLWPRPEVLTPVTRWEEVTTPGDSAARAHHIRGLALLQQGGPRARLRAVSSFVAAMDLEPEQPLHMLALAWTKAQSGFHDEAVRLLRELLEAHPGCRAAHMDLARLLAERSLWYRTMESGPITLHRWGERLFEQARTHYEEAALLAPSDPEPWLELGELLLAWERWDESVDVLVRARSRSGDGKVVCLLLATACHWSGNDELADTLFQEGLTYLGPDELEPYLHPPTGVRADADPLLLTPWNERLLEHYTRVTFSTLSFSHPNGFAKTPDLPGWQTDRGQTLIRYGLPQRRALLRPEVIPGQGLLPPTDLWDYGGFDLLFEDSFLNGRYPFLDVPPGDRSPHFRRSRELLEARNLSVKLGELYGDPYGALRDSLMLDVYRLPSADSLTAVLVASLWADDSLPRQNRLYLQASEAEGGASLWPAGLSTITEAQGSKLLHAQWTQKVAPGAYDVWIEWGWPGLRRVASHRGRIELPGFHEPTAVGDVIPLVASGEVAPGTLLPHEGWSARASACWPLVDVRALPRGIVPDNGAFGVYLHVQSAGTRGTSLQWELLKPRPTGLLARLSFGLLGRGYEALVGWEEGFTVLPGTRCRVVNVDVAALPAGDYLLRLRLPDVPSETATTLPVVVPEAPSGPE